MKRLLLGAAMCALLLQSCHCDEKETVQTLKTKPNANEGKDAIIGSIVPNNNYGNMADFHIYNWTQDGELNTVRGLIEFGELSKIPTNATIQKATLSLYYNYNSKYQEPLGKGHQGDNALIIKRVTCPWQEDKVTWKTQPSTVDTHQVLVPKSWDGAQNYTIDVTLLVKDIVSSKSNNGFLIQHQQEEPYKVNFFASSDHPDQKIHPQLMVTYQVAPKKD